MGAETSAGIGGGANSVVPGLMSGPSVDQLLNSINGQPVTPSTPGSEKPVSAGVLSQAQTKPPPTMGRSAPKETGTAVEPKPAASTKAKDLGPEISVTSTTAFSREGLLTQAGVRATFKLNDRTSVTTTVRERLKDFSQNGKESVLDTRVSAQIKFRAVDEPQVKFDVSLEGYGQFNQPLGGGDASIQLGLVPGFGLSYLPTKNFSLGLNGYADLSRTLPMGADSIVVGGDVNAALKFGGGFKFTAGVRAESPNLLKDGGTPRVAGFGSLTKQLGEHFSVGAEVIGGFVGDPTLSTSFAGAGDVTGVIKASYTF
jgi:hypothetical protein